MSQAGINSSSSSGGSSVNTLTGNTGGVISPDASHNITILGTGSITVTGNAATHTLTISDAQAAWQTTSTNVSMSSNIGYFCISPGGNLSLLLPAVSSLGDEIKVSLIGASSFTITQGAGQQITLGNKMTTPGVGGSLMSTAQGDSITLVCWQANTLWVVINSIGNLTVV